MDPGGLAVFIRPLLLLTSDIEYSSGKNVLDHGLGTSLIYGDVYAQHLDNSQSVLESIPEGKIAVNAGYRAEINIF